ncbi:MAG: DUF6320 domain-containing protein [Lachnospiraceae bacterium]
MKVCKECMVEVLDKEEFCPLCHEKLVEIEEERKIMKEVEYVGYPKIPFDIKRILILKNTFFLCLFLLSILAVGVNYIYFRGIYWSVPVVIAIFYFWLMVNFCLKTYVDWEAKIMLHGVVIIIASIALDKMTKSTGWSLQYMVPSVIVSVNFAVLFCMIMREENHKESFIRQFFWMIFNLGLFLAFFIEKIPVTPFIILATISSIIALVSSIIVTRRTFFHELERRFHR